jgi:hypothetical protein
MLAFAALLAGWQLGRPLWPAENPDLGPGHFHLGVPRLRRGAKRVVPRHRPGHQRRRRRVVADPALASIGHTFHDEVERAKAWAFWGGCMGVAMTAAPTLAG